MVEVDSRYKVGLGRKGVELEGTKREEKGKV